ncbi:zinc transporter Yke4p [Monosporozyma unispora]
MMRRRTVTYPLIMLASVCGLLLVSLGVLPSNVVGNQGHSHSHDLHHLESKDHHHGHSHSHISAPSPYLPNFVSIWSLALQKYLNEYVFIFSDRYNSILATVIIQLLPFIVILFLTSLKFNLKSPLINKVLIPFAFGTLLSDISLHLLPECNVSEDNSLAGIGIFLGILSFISIDKIVKILTNSNESGHSHSHSHSLVEEEEVLIEKRKGKKGKGKKVQTKKVIPSTPVEKKQFNASIILNVITGLLHNITDGIAIASAFYSSKQTGIITTVAMIFHETPHQLGDFVILFSNGMSIRSCLYTQVLTIISCVVGTVIGCYINEVGSSSTLIDQASASSLMLPMITGGLIYISMVSILPEFMSPGEQSGSRCKKLFDFILQVSSIIAGFAIIAIM